MPPPPHDPLVNPLEPCLLSRDLRVLVEPQGPLSVARRAAEVEIRSCEACDGQGHTFEYDDRGYRFLRRCKGGRLDAQILRFNQAKIPGRYHEASLDTFDCHTPSLEMTVDDLRDYLEGFSPGQRGRLFVGSVGCGKTHLLVSCLRWLTLEKGLRCRFIEFTHLLSELRGGFSKNRPESELLDPLVKIPVLGIDELGKGHNSKFEHRIIDELISRRYNETGVTTLFTTNYYPRTHARESAAPIEYLSDRIGERAASRIYEMCDFTPMVETDYRKYIHLQKWQNY